MIQKPRFPEEFIEYGKFVLHSGLRSNARYDVNSMLKNDFYLKYVLDKIPKSEHYIGIATGGASMAIATHTRFPNSKFSTIHDGELKRDYPKGNWILLDDVTTTGGSLLEAIALIGSNPKEIIVAMDRRWRNINPEIVSIFEPVPAWLLL